MHYQVVVNPADAAMVKTPESTISIYPDSQRFVSKIEEFEEEIVYDVYHDKIVVIKETTDGESVGYDPEREYNFRVLPVMIGLICFIHNRRVVEVGRSRHAVMTYKLNGEGRFRVMSEQGKITLHEREGLIFIQEDSHYLAVPDELIASLFIAKLGHSIRFFDEKYLVRFTTARGQYFYFPWSDVYINPEMRKMKYRHIPEVVMLEWDVKEKEIEKHVEDYTNPYVTATR